MNILKRLVAWLKRCGHSRGFGIQSPWAYQFVRYTINETYPYYSYDSLRKKTPGLDGKKRKWYELFFRCANYKQPQTVLYYGNDFDRFSAYCHQGCKKSRIISLDGSSLSGISSIDMLYLSYDKESSALCSALLDKVDEHSMFIIDHISDGREAQHFWKALTDDPRTGVVFDLYHCGIIFFDKKRYKEKYLINF